MGSIYKRGNVLWIKYYDHGKPICESAKTDKKMVAKKLLDQREGEIAQGKVPGIHFEKVKFDELSKDFITDYKINGKKSLERAEISAAHLKKAFEGYKVPEITTSRINTYVEKRMEDGASNSTINRELAALKRMLNLGARTTPPKVDRVPYIPMLKENNVRKGFFEHADFVSLRDALPSYLKGFITFAYKTGWRKTEIAGLQWSQVDLENGIVCLNPGETKNDQARTVYLDSELKEIFEAQHELRKKNNRITPFVFTNKSGKDKICDFRGSWEKACTDAKIGIRLFHDFRRSAVRNMVRAGIPERVAMMISGHQTRSVFERYNIVNDEDLRSASMKQELYLNAQKSVTGTNSVTVGNFGQAAKAAK